MKLYKLYEEVLAEEWTNTSLFDEIDDFSHTDHGEIIDEKIIKEKSILRLYRGLRAQRQLGDFTEPDTNPELIDMGDKYLLKVNKYPDKLIWFTDDKNFAEKYNGWGLIIYDLPVINHKKIVKYEDGHQDIKFTRSNSVESGFGGVISADPGRNSHFYRGIELPNHWYWSYKGQKHIVCDADLLIPKDSVIRLNN